MQFLQEKEPESEFATDKLAAVRIRGLKEDLFPMPSAELRRNKGDE